MSEVKICKDCKFYDYRVCLHSMAMLSFDYVGGDTIQETATEMRKTLCGYEGHLFVPSLKTKFKQFFMKKG